MQILYPEIRFYTAQIHRRFERGAVAPKSRWSPVFNLIFKFSLDLKSGTSGTKGTAGICEIPQKIRDWDWDRDAKSENPGSGTGTGTRN